MTERTYPILQDKEKSNYPQKSARIHVEALEEQWNLLAIYIATIKLSKIY